MHVSLWLGVRDDGTILTNEWEICGIPWVCSTLSDPPMSKECMQFFQMSMQRSHCVVPSTKRHMQLRPLSLFSELWFKNSLELCSVFLPAFVTRSHPHWDGVGNTACEYDGVCSTAEEQCFDRKVLVKIAPSDILLFGKFGSLCNMDD